eukprot:4428133-Prymnesium_polylepis.1
MPPATVRQSCESGDEGVNDSKRHGDVYTEAADEAHQSRVGRYSCAQNQRGAKNAQAQRITKNAVEQNTEHRQAGEGRADDR